MDDIAVTIVGGGVIGCAVARELSTSMPGGILVLERNRQIPGENQSARTSGVIHAGIYYPPQKQPLAARMCVEGNRLMYEFCTRHDVPAKRTGKLVVATSEHELPYLNDLHETALANGVPDVREVAAAEIARLEPNVRAHRALYVPSSGIVAAPVFVERLRQLADARGVTFLTSTRLLGLTPETHGFSIEIATASGTERYFSRLVINAAGLYADEVARMVDPAFPYEVDPVRAESVRFLRTSRPELAVSGMHVYPVPRGVAKTDGRPLELEHSEYRKLLAAGAIAKTDGIHLLPTFELSGEDYVIGKTVVVVPASVEHVGKEDLTATYPPAYYIEHTRGYFPALVTEDLAPNQCGVMVRLKGFADFVIEHDRTFKNLIHLVGIRSPGFTASLAIAKVVRAMALSV
jgi:(S)-2-hydroxyglutarate dehydrogenase